MRSDFQGMVCSADKLDAERVPSSFGICETLCQVFGCSVIQSNQYWRFGKLTSIHADEDTPDKLRI